MSYPFDRVAHDHLELAKALLRKQHALSYQKEHGGSFVRAWDKVLLDHPDLAESREELSPTSQPTYQPPLPGQVAADQLKLDQLLRKLNLPRKIEARKPPREDDDDTPMLVYGVGTPLD